MKIIRLILAGLILAPFAPIFLAAFIPFGIVVGVFGLIEWAVNEIGIRVFCDNEVPF